MKPAGELDLAVVGAGPAGCAAAVQATRMGLSVLLLDRTGRAGGLTANAWRIENYPGLEEPVPGPEYVRRLRLLLNRFGLKVQRTEIGSVESCGDSLVLAGTGVRDLRARTVVLATGTAPRSAGFRGERGSALVHTEVRRLDDMSAGHALVLGGGEAALDYALSLADWGWRSTVLVRSKRIRAEGRLLDAVRARKDIRLICGASLLELEESGVRATALIQTAEGRRRVQTDAVLVAVGRRPVIPDLPSGARVDGPGPVRGLRGAFCAGDAAVGSLGQACTAAGQGLEAAGRAFRYLRGR